MHQAHPTSPPTPPSSDSQPNLPPTRSRRIIASIRTTMLAFLRQSYMLLLLCLPLLYAARVHGRSESSPHSVTTTDRSWRRLLPILITEWKMLQVISAALLSAIFTIFQFTGTSTGPMMQTAGFVSLVCAFVSFLCGWLFIIHFGEPEATPESANGDAGIRMSELEAVTDTSRQWSEMLYTAAQDRYGFWNVWVLLALPAIWTAWSTITFTVFILLFLWSAHSSTGSFLPDLHLSFREQITAAAVITELSPRVVATVVLLVGAVYLALAVRTLRSWRERS